MLLPPVYQETVLAGVPLTSEVAEPGGEPRRRLYIDVQEFTGDERGAVTLHAAWLIQTPNAPSERGTEEIKVAASDATANALAAAMSRALADFADRIAAALAPHADKEKSE